MSSKLNRAAAGVFAALMAVAVFDVTSSWAQATPNGSDMISTTCGAGTAEKCADKQVEDCDWDVDISVNFSQRSFSFHIKRTDCKPAGTVPIYKDNPRDSYSLSFSCDLLKPFLGMPAGSGCS